MVLTNGNVCIRDFSEEDIKNKVEWINNSENNEFLHYDIPLCYEKTLDWYRNKDNAVRFDGVIEYENKPVGLIGLVSIDQKNKKAEFYISMGETAFKGKGIAKKSTKLLLMYAFRDLDLNKVYLNVDDDNLIACKLYEKVGFKCEGVFINDMFHRGKYINRKRYAILQDDFLVE